MRRNRIARRKYRRFRLWGLLLAALLLFGLPAGEKGAPEVYALSAEEARAVAEGLTDETARAEILQALDQGAEVTYTYDGQGQVTAYRIVLEEVAKYFNELSEEEKTTVLQGLLDRKEIPYAITVKGVSYPLSTYHWNSRGVICYGDVVTVNRLVQATSSPNYDSATGQWRYLGFDLNGGLYGNDDFPRDSDSGTPAWEKDWLTRNAILSNGTATGYLGSFTLNSSFSSADEAATARLFLKENKQWERAGLDVAYILEHFYFNGVVTDSGLTQGQFVGVHVNSYGIWYQNFTVEQKLPQFVVTEGYVKTGTLDGTEPPEAGAEEELLPEEPLEMSGEAILEIPAFAYEGHPVLAVDKSLFEVEGNSYSAARMYGEKLARNKFSILQEDAGTVTRAGDTRSQFCFHESGNYTARLQVTLDNGEKLYDSSPVEVGPAPALEASLGGVQKENRKQLLFISAATHPDYPVEELWAEIFCPTTGERVRLVHRTDGGKNSLENTAGIKTRPIEAGPSSELYTRCTLSFLTKNTEEELYEYRVFVRDSRGHTDELSGSFIVAPDLPPEAAIDMDGAFLREAGSDAALAEAADATVTDGDQVERSWSLALLPAGTTPGALAFSSPAALSLSYTPLEQAPGFTDLSMSSGQLQRVGFEKEGVGAFALGLKVKEVWTEATLEEYVTEEDYKTGSAEAFSQVINIAPKVSLEPLQYQSAGVLLLGAGEEETALLEESIPLLRQHMLENNVDARLTAARLLPRASDLEEGAEQTPKQNFSVREPFGYEGGWTLWAGDCFFLDDSRLYTIQASWPATGLAALPASPYTITARDAFSGSVLWTYTFDDSTLPLNHRQASWSGSRSRFAGDESGRFLFFRSGKGQTLVLSASNGAFQTVLPLELGDCNYTGENSIYSLRGDGIWRIRLHGGQCTQIYSGEISGQGARLLGGELHFLVKKADGLYRGRFHPVTETLELEKLMDAVDGWSGLSFTLLGADAEASLIVHSLDADQKAQVQVFSADNGQKSAFSLSKTSGVSSATASCWAPAYNEYGVCDWLVSSRSFHRSGSSNYSNYVDFYNVDTGKAHSVRVVKKKKYYTGHELIFARQLGSRVYASTDGVWTYVLNYGYGAYSERAATFVLDQNSGSITYSQGGPGFNSYAEYGHGSETGAVIHTDDNSSAQIQGSISTVIGWEQTPRQILSRYISKYADGSRDLNWVA
ncbi:MAG: hypothetical protein Q4C22_02850, partial [Bacillota bacterium]|nr:hypothetical protein [Bacillota bacterium]